MLVNIVYFLKLLRDCPRLSTFSLTKTVMEGHQYLFVTTAIKWVFSPFSIQWLVCQLLHSTWVWSLQRISGSFSYINGKKIFFQNNKPLSPSGFDHVIWHDPSPYLQHVSYHTKCLVMLDQSPITIRDTGTSDLSPLQHIDALWCNSYAREIRFTVELQFCQKLQRPLVFSILRWIFCNITWFIDNSPLKRSRQ